MWWNFIKNSHVLPIFLRIVKQAVEIHIIHQCYSDHCCQSWEAPFPLQPPLHYHQQQVRYQCHPNLYLDGIEAFAIEVFQWEVLLDLLEKQLNLPPLAVNGYNVVKVWVPLVSNDMSLCFRVSAYVIIRALWTIVCSLLIFFVNSTSCIRTSISPSGFRYIVSLVVV